MRVFKSFFIFLFCISFFFQGFFCGLRHSKLSLKNEDRPSFSPRSFSSSSSETDSENSDSEVNEDEVMRKIDELLQGFDGYENESDDSDNYGSGYEGDDEYDYEDLIAVVIDKLLVVGVKEMFEKVAQLKTNRFQFYKVFMMEKNRKKVLTKLLSSNPNNKILRIEVCAALGYVKELEEVLNRSKKIAIIIMGRYEGDNKTLLDYAKDFGFTEVAKILENYLKACG